MIIFSQDKTAIINIENTSCVFARWQDGAFIQTEDILLGRYRSKERAVEIMEEIMDAYDRGNPYRMPEE